MASGTTAETQTWVRAELAGSNAAFGAQLLIPADGLEFHENELVFQRQGEIVYVAAAGQLRSVTWLAKQPNPELDRRRAQWPKHGTRWTADERDELRLRLAAGEEWNAVSAAHGRLRSGVQQEAAKQGWVDSDTFEVRPEVRPEVQVGDAADVTAPG